MMTDDQILEVVQAHKEGKKIEKRVYAESGSTYWTWIPDPRPSWDFGDTVYRVAPEPRSNRWTCRIEDEAIVVNTGWEDIRFNRSPGLVVLFDKLVDIHNGSIISTPENPPRKPRE